MNAPNRGLVWQARRVKRLLKGLRFAEDRGDMTMCRIITKEVRRVLLKN